MIARRLLENQTAAAGLIACLVVVAIVTLRTGGAMQWLELFAHDLYIAGRAGEPSAEPRVVIVGVTEEEITAREWPLSDAVLADLLRRLVALEPAAIGVDIYRDQPVREGGKSLAEVLRADDRIIWVSKFGEGTWQGVPPPAALRDTDRFGFADMIADPGGIVRRGLLFLDDGQTVSLSLALRLALRYLEPRGIGMAPDAEEPAHLRLGSITFVPFEASDGGYVDADAKGYQYTLDYVEGPAPFPVYSLCDVLKGRLEPEAIRGRMVIVGVTAESVKDYFHTPFSYGSTVDQTTYGAVLQGIMAAQLVRHALDATPTTKSWGQSGESLWTLLWVLIGASVARFLRSPLYFVMVALASVAILIASTFVAFLWYWWIPLVPPLIGGAAAAGLTTSYLSYRERLHRDLLMGLFARYVSTEVAEEIWVRRDEFMQRGRPKPQRVTATVLFSDIKGFTSVSEAMDEAALMDWLNLYMEVMARQVMDHHGVVSKFIGDAVMAIFGVPVPHAEKDLIANDARNAARCALAMVEELKKLNVKWIAEGLPPVNIRVGIHTGTLVAGSLGSADRLEYTVIGDTVNTAARLESFADNFSYATDEEAPGRIAISEATYALLGEDFVARPVGEAELKGKSQKVGVYQLSGSAGWRPKLDGGDGK